jgi:hypothetical protein
MTLNLPDPLATYPTPDSQNLERLAYLLDKLPTLTFRDRALIYTAWDAADRNPHPADSARRQTWHDALAVQVLPEDSHLAPFLLWEAVTQAAKPGIPATPPTPYQIMRGLEWAAFHQN